MPSLCSLQSKRLRGARLVFFAPPPLMLSGCKLVQQLALAGLGRGKLAAKPLLAFARHRFGALEPLVTLLRLHRLLLAITSLR